jgi:sulfotransferase
MKQYYFISGLPRSGSTLLSAILKQNPDFYADIASPIQKISEISTNIITGGENNFNIGENQRKNLMYGIFDGYYKHIKKPVIFDSSRSWTKKTTFLKTLFPNTKILCTVRDIISILNSFESLLNKNCFYTKQINEKIFSENIFIRIEELFEREILNYHSFLLEGYTLNPEMIMIIEYEDLCKTPEKIMKKIYEFLEKPYYFQHDFENLEYSNKNFDMTCNLKNLHTIKRKIEYLSPKYIIPIEIIKKYKEMKMEFWKQKQNFDIINNLEEKFIKYQ